MTAKLYGKGSSITGRLFFRSSAPKLKLNTLFPYVLMKTLALRFHFLKGEHIMTNIGSNQFKNGTFPLVFQDHYFMLETSNEKDVWTVLKIKDGDLIIEVLKK